VKHGITAKVVVIGGEDPGQFELFRASLEEEFEPQASLERELVERLVGYAWRLRRIPIFEAAVMQGWASSSLEDLKDERSALAAAGHGSEPWLIAAEEAGNEMQLNLDRLASAEAINSKTLSTDYRGMKPSYRKPFTEQRSSCSCFKALAAPVSG
jgi:hypothetical protein